MQVNKYSTDDKDVLTQQDRSDIKKNVKKFMEGTTDVQDVEVKYLYFLLTC